MLPVPAREAIAALLPAPDAPAPAWEAAFSRLAALLIHRGALVAGGAPHRIAEVELYYSGGAHLDPYAHRDPIQREVGRWYFHRTGGTYRGGSYKGLDVSFGRGDTFGGALIRALLTGDDPPAYVEGPSLIVDRLLRLTGAPSVQALADRGGLSIDPLRGGDPPRGGDAPLRLRVGDAPAAPPPIFTAPRVGLGFKRGDLDEKRRWFGRRYRFLVDPARVRKGLPQLVVALHRDGRDPAEIAALTRARLATVERFIEAFRRGRGRDLATLRGDLTPDEVCEALGACERFW